MPEKIRYRTIDVCDGEMRRVRVAVHHGFEGFWSKVTLSCSGCHDSGGGYAYCEKARCEVGAGCHECGYTGKRVERFFTPFDSAKFERWVDERWERKQRLLKFWRRKQ